jgi:hypothetical protein
MSKREKQIINDLTSVVHNTYAELLDKIIVRVDDSLVVFNQYAIDKNNDYFTVTRRRDMSKFRFNAGQHAITFVILDHYNKYHDALRVKTLDSLIVGVKLELAIHDKLKTSTDFEKRSIFLTKSQTDRDRNKRFTAEMNKYITTAKSLFLKQE